MPGERFRCPGCGVLLDKSAAASVLGRTDAAARPLALSGTTACPRCAFAIPVKAMVEGRYDERFDWVLVLACVSGTFGAFAWHHGKGRPGAESFGVGLVVLFGTMGLAAVLERAWDALSGRR